MTFTNYLASFFEAIKFKNPKVFALIQSSGVAVFFILQFRPEWITRFIMLTPNEINWILAALMSLGAYTSTSTTNSLSPEHKKIKEIEAKNAGELELEKHKV